MDNNYAHDRAYRTYSSDKDGQDVFAKEEGYQHPEHHNNSADYSDPVAGLPEQHHMEHFKQSDRLRRSLSARQVQLIAIGGTIGTG